MQGKVTSVSRSPVHGFSKDVVEQIQVLAGLGVEGDAHAGVTVRHRYRVRKNPAALNLCQLHLLQGELFAELAAKGFRLEPGELGENVTTEGIDLLTLPVGAVLHLGEAATVEITGLREPCVQMNGLRPGLMKACLARSAGGGLIRKAGVMGIATGSGPVSAGDAIRVTLPPQPWRTMGPV